MCVCSGTALDCLEAPEPTNPTEQTGPVPAPVQAWPLLSVPGLCRHRERCIPVLRYSHIIFYILSIIIIIIPNFIKSRSAQNPSIPARPIGPQQGEGFYYLVLGGVPELILIAPTQHMVHA